MHRQKVALVSKMGKISSMVVDSDEDTAGFTQRMLMSMVLDLSCLAKDVERVKVQVFALARENGVPLPHDDD